VAAGAGPAAAGKSFAVRFQFRTWNPDALLLSVQLQPEPRRLRLHINGSRLQLSFRGAAAARSEVTGGELTDEDLRLKIEQKLR